MNLVVDIGNTDIVAGYHHQASWLHMWRLPSENYPMIEDFLRRKLEENGINDLKLVVLSSVVPSAVPVVQDALQVLTGLQPVLIGPDLFRRLDMHILQPAEIGSDLVANAYAAWSRFKTACVAVDFGTALTFTAVSSEGNIEGVAIAPGLRTAAHALFLKAARLPEIPLALPETAIGKDTTHALQSGILFGYVGLVKEMVSRFREELGGSCRLIATGGLSRVLTPIQDFFDQIDPTLTLDGLRLLGEWELASKGETIGKEEDKKGK